MQAPSEALTLGDVGEKLTALLSLMEQRLEEVILLSSNITTSLLIKIKKMQSTIECL